MAVTVRVESDGELIVEVTTDKAHIAADTVYNAVETANAEEASADCDCDECVQESQVEDCGCPPDVCLEELFNQPEVDPNYYTTGNNDLTVDESADRAAKRVREILERQDVVKEQDAVGYIDIPCYGAISAGVPRNKLYEIAGQIAKGRRDSDLYAGVPLALVFVHQVGSYLERVALGA